MDRFDQLHLGYGLFPVPLSVAVPIMIGLMTIWAQKNAVFRGSIFPISINVMKVHYRRGVISAFFTFGPALLHEPPPQCVRVFRYPVSVGFPIKGIVLPSVGALIPAVLGSLFHPGRVHKKGQLAVKANQLNPWHIFLPPSRSIA